MTSGKVGFMKDLSMDADFPPHIIQAEGSQSIPNGHLRPLGYQRSPENPVEDYEGIVDAQIMYNNYISQNLPVVFRDSILDSPVFENWEKDDYLKERYGSVNVSVVTRKGIKREYLIRERKTLKMKKFLLEYMYEDWYLAGTVPLEMLKELPLPKCVQCGSVANYLREAELWMSSGGTSSQIHAHNDHYLHCVLFGRRDFILIENAYKDAFEFRNEFPNSLGGHSPLDMDFINAIKYKKISTTPWTWATLQQGDCILIPAGFLHQVRSYGRSISETILITPTPFFDATGCDKKQYKKPKTLADAAFMWSFEEGKRVLKNWNLNAESLRYLLLAELRTQEKLPIEQFIVFYQEAMVWGQEDLVPGATVFAMLFETGTREVTREDIMNLSPEKLKKAAKIFNKPYVDRPRKSQHKHTEL
ncbi:hypothetical protein LOTGIDRAFT_171502 [Lottia gigantea]|uniref:JmjC domain-containing protein n=1 Tax=Lottia gigantea TaxID=225164 RepID=V4B788_LOTGI|nr:hypothetical protein LOTGIDRAFT_171502 [Lottia gigantea]ESP03411.1 hypothetical protein LOTGIDRAFT_171502 [Lottia gigantea]